MHKPKIQKFLAPAFVFLKEIFPIDEILQQAII